MTTPFSHYNPIGAICCHQNQSSDPNWPKHHATSMALQIQFGGDGPVGLRDSHVLKVFTNVQINAHTYGRKPARVSSYKLTSEPSVS